MDHGVVFLNQERLADDERKPRGHDDAVEMQVRRQTGSAQHVLGAKKPAEIVGSRKS
jgi:hypothetical protein